MCYVQYNKLGGQMSFECYYLQKYIQQIIKINLLLNIYGFPLSIIILIFLNAELMII